MPKDLPLFEKGDSVRYEGKTFTVGGVSYNESIGEYIYVLERHDYLMSLYVRHSEAKDRVRKTSGSFL